MAEARGGRGRKGATRASAGKRIATRVLPNGEEWTLGVCPAWVVCYHGPDGQWWRTTDSPGAFATPEEAEQAARAVADGWTPLAGEDARHGGP